MRELKRVLVLYFIASHDEYTRLFCYRYLYLIDNNGAFQFLFSVSGLGLGYYTVRRADSALLYVLLYYACTGII